MSLIRAASLQPACFDSENLPHLLLSRQRPAKNLTPTIFVAGPKKRTKKGPKRVKKSVAQLDQEMEDYRATATDRKVA
jgi:hypothetical protein